MKKKRFLTIFAISSTLVVAYNHAISQTQSQDIQGINHIMPVTAVTTNPYSISSTRAIIFDSTTAWTIFKKEAIEKLNINANTIAKLKAASPTGSESVKKEYRNKISDFERRNDNQRNNISVIKGLANESLAIFKNNFLYENNNLVKEMQLLMGSTTYL